MNSKLSRLKAWLILIPFSPFICFFAFLLFQFVVNEPQAKSAQAQLEIESSQIEHLPSSTLLDHSASHKTNNALVSEEYFSVLPYSQIRKYYDVELAKHGWQLFSEHKLTNWGQDLGGHITIYCKDNYEASLQYAGVQANYGWTYALSFSWSLEDCKTAASGGWVKLPVVDAIFLLSWCLFLALVMMMLAWKSWTAPQSLSFSNLSIWYVRLISIIGLAIFSIGIFAGAYSLWRHLFER